MSSTNRTSKKDGRRKVTVRILALIMALIMVIGAAYILVSMLAASVGAAEVYGTNDVIDTSSLSTDEDVLVSVGLMYGDEVEVEFQVRSDTGFVVGIQELEGEKTFTEIWELPENTISCLSDANIAKYSGIYSLASSYYETYIGGYHVQIDCDDLGREEFESFFGTVQYYLSGWGINIAPAYVYTGYAIRIGDFAKWEDAAVYLDAICQTFPERVVSVVAPTRNAVCVIDSYTDRIIFEYDCGLNSVIGFKAHEDNNGNTYMKTPAGNVYDGVFAFRRFVDNLNDGVSLINILPLEAYVAGVLPNEISNSWPIEVQKEFAVTVRSFTLTHLNSKHSFYEFDLCSTTCCEVYRGAGKINETVMEAVTSTKGQVICYEGDIVTSYYSSTAGGVTVSPADCWGGAEVPYLQAIETPWEDYMGHENGFWICEVTPTELLERLNKAGYNELQGSVADVEIEELAKNSTYVKKLGITDIYGTHITIEYTDKVRTSLTPYVNSANFVVGRGSVEYTERTVVEGSDGEADETKYTNAVDAENMVVLTADGYCGLDYGGALTVLTADGLTECAGGTLCAATKETADGGSGFLNSVPKDNVEHVNKTAYADNPNNFIFVGKGWGHGVGLSQWGCYDLAVKGYKCEDIIKAYLPTITLVDYHTTNNYKKMKSE